MHQSIILNNKMSFEKKYVLFISISNKSDQEIEEWK